MISCVCIGAAHIDQKMSSIESMILKTSNPVSTHYSYGGVARNVCENLVRQGVSTAMISRLGNDADALAVVNHLENLGVKVEGISVSESLPTAKYTSLLDVSGDMVVACADMNIYNEITPDVIYEPLEKYRDVPFWVVDMNVPLETVESIVEVATYQTLWLLSVSIPKICIYREKWSLLGKFDGLSLNKEELAALVDGTCDTVDEIADACSTLHEKGLKKLLVTMGKGGVIFSEGTTVCHHPIEKECEVVETTGAGDAFIAGVLCGQIKGHSLSMSVSMGMDLARHALRSHESVAILTEDTACD
jgi:sugar/nucleoside kinase (ribokinase family)